VYVYLTASQVIQPEVVTWARTKRSARKKKMNWNAPRIHQNTVTSTTKKFRSLRKDQRVNRARH